MMKKELLLAALSLGLTSYCHAEPNSSTSPAKGPADALLAAEVQATYYQVQVRPDADADWQDHGTWILGGRVDQRPIELRIASRNSGRDVVGQVKYAQREGMLVVNLRRAEGRRYTSETKAGNNDPVAEGPWLLGGVDEPIERLRAESNDDGHTLTGTVTFDGGEPMEFRATLADSRMDESPAEAEAPATQPVSDWDGTYVRDGIGIIISGNGTKLALIGNDVMAPGEITKVDGDHFEGRFIDGDNVTPFTGTKLENGLRFTVAEGMPIDYQLVPMPED